MSRGHELAMRLRAAYLSMHRGTNAALAAHGLTADHFVLLTALVDTEGITQKELGRRTTSDPNTTSEMLARLEKLGLVERRPHPRDRRARSVRLTALGARRQRERWDAGVSIRAHLENLFSPDELNVLVTRLDRMIDAFSPTPLPRSPHEIARNSPARLKNPRRNRAGDGEPN